MTKTMQASYAKNDIVVLSSSAKDNDSYRNIFDAEMRVTHVSTKYMPAQHFFAQGKPEGYHPGFDDCGFALYDLELLDGSPVPVSIYDWELEAKS